MQFFNQIGNWWDQNFVQPTIVNRANNQTLGSQWKNSTGILTPQGPVTPDPMGGAPVVTDTGYTPLQPITAPQTAYPSNFAPIGSSAVNNAISGTTPTTTASVSNFSPIGSSAVNQAIAGTTPTTATPSVTPTANDTSFFANAWEGIGGWEGVQSGLQTASGLFQAYQGMQALNLAEDTFNFQKDAWNQNYAMQKDAYDRQVAQVESRKDFLARSDTKE